MIKCFKLKSILLPIAIILISAIISIGIVAVTELTDTPFLPYCIVLDAGHGYNDNGCSGTNGGIESDINLEITFKLEKILKDFGFKVVLTRKDKNGLYDEDAPNHKVSDMEKRKDIITQANPDFVISIHCNSYPDTSLRGAQAFYKKDNEESLNLATAIQETLTSQIPYAKKEANFGDYYILNESPANAVLIECGYLTNPEDEALLISPDHQQKLAYAIACGIVKYFDIAKD